MGDLRRVYRRLLYRPHVRGIPTPFRSRYSSRWSLPRPPDIGGPPRRCRVGWSRRCERARYPSALSRGGRRNPDRMSVRVSVRRRLTGRGPILCGRRRAPLDSALMDRPGDSARNPARIVVIGPAHNETQRRPAQRPATTGEPQTTCHADLRQDTISLGRETRGGGRGLRRGSRRKWQFRGG